MAESKNFSELLSDEEDPGSNNPGLPALMILSPEDRGSKNFIGISNATDSKLLVEMFPIEIVRKVATRKVTAAAGLDVAAIGGNLEVKHHLL